MTNTVLVIYAHPTPRRSRYNGALAAAAAGMDGVAVRDLYELYPDFHIDVAAEQAALKAADVLVFQFPIYWFSSPAILKEWQDEVLTKGFAFGPTGTALAGKRFALALSSGGAVSSYSGGGPHGAPIEVYLTPLEQTARFCGMEVSSPFISQGVGAMNRADVIGAADRYHDWLQAFVEGRG